MKNSPLVHEFRPSWTNGLFCIDFFLIFTTSSSVSAMLTGPIVSEAFHEEIHAIMDVIFPRNLQYIFSNRKRVPQTIKIPRWSERFQILILNFDATFAIIITSSSRGFGFDSHVFGI